MSTPATSAQLLKGALLPALWILALPAVSLAFSAYVEARWDGMVREAIVASVEQDGALSEAERAEGRVFAAAFSAAEACGSDDPELAPIRGQLGEACDDYAQMRWMRLGSVTALGLAFVTALVGAGAAVAAFRSRAAQIPAFFVAWNVMRVTGAVQVALQGALAFGLSFWLTAYFFEMYSVKLLLVVGFLALAGVATVVRAVFARVDPVTEVDGVPISEADAPAFWARLRELADRVGTAPPERVFAGIDDNFFVTETPQLAGGRRYDGRALYVSLSLLRTLGRSEAEAVLCHELAHFSGGDTAHSQRLGPGLERYNRYLQGLAASPAGWPVLHVMRAFALLFTWALARTSRERELRADRVAADTTSARDVASSLLRVAAYSGYRREVERELFQSNRELETVAIAERVRSGFAAFTQRPDLAERLGTVPHPLDTHPPNEERFASLGVALPAREWGEVLLSPLPDSWYEGIPVAPRIEAELWTAYEANFVRNHEIRRAFETTPRTEEELAVVTRHFPEVPVLGKDGARIGTVDWQGVHLDGREALLFDAVKTASVEEPAFRGKRLLVDGKLLVVLSDLRDADAFLGTFNHYWSRAQVARAAAQRAAG